MRACPALVLTTLAVAGLTAACTSPAPMEATGSLPPAVVATPPAMSTPATPVADTAPDPAPAPDQLASVRAAGGPVEGVTPGIDESRPLDRASARDFFLATLQAFSLTAATGDATALTALFAPACTGCAELAATAEGEFAGRGAAAGSWYYLDHLSAPVVDPAAATATATLSMANTSTLRVVDVGLAVRDGRYQLTSVIDR